MENRMTIHRGLAELKLIDNKIERAITELYPCGLKQGDEGKVNDLETEEEFATAAKAKYQKITNLIDRKQKIKSAIVKANAVTTVTVAGESMTIADAINFKTIVKIKDTVATKLKLRFDKAVGQMNTTNEQVEANALRIAEAALQKDNVKIGDNDAVSITDPYIKKNKCVLVDPLGAEKLAEELVSKNDDFEAEIDAVLSEINATTFIEI